jgi:hypothetical protein
MARISIARQAHKNEPVREILSWGYSGRQGTLETSRKW